MGVNSLPKTVTRQRRDCDLNPGPSAPESSTLTTRLPSHASITKLNKSAAVQCNVLQTCEKMLESVLILPTCGNLDILFLPLR